MNFQSASLAKPTNGFSLPELIRKPLAIRSPFKATFFTAAAVAGVYYLFLAAPMYVSEGQFTVREQLPPTVSSTGAATASGEALAVLADTIAVQQQIQSQEMLEALDKQFHLRAEYSRFRIDPLHWLKPNASDEAFLKFYRHMVTVKLDRQSGLIEVDVRSFDRTSSRQIAEAIMSRTEAFVDGMTKRVRDETMLAAQSELDRAREQANAARLAVASYRGVTSTVDPGQAGLQTLSGQTQFESEAAEAQAELASALTFNNPDSPVVQQMQAKLAVIQAAAAKRRSAQGVGGQAKQVTNFESLTTERAAAEQRLISAVAGFEMARALAVQHEKYVVRVVNPSRPDRPTEPRRIIDWLTVMLFVLTGYASVSLIIAGIRDHRGV